jgi:hypothetical protein
MELLPSTIFSGKESLPPQSDKEYRMPLIECFAQQNVSTATLGAEPSAK